MVKNVKKNVVTAGIQISALLLMGNASQDVKQVTRMYTVKHVSSYNKRKYIELVLIKSGILYPVNNLNVSNSTDLSKI